MYIYSCGFSLLLSGVAFALLMAIYFSIVYIFKIWEGRQIEEAVIEYSAMVISLILFPMVFLTYLPRALGGELRGSRFADTLLNYIVTPALLIYTGILYLYFIQITLSWELPQGGIAYLVFGFIILAMIVQALQLFVSQRLYDWYFNIFSLLSIPALIMFWIGVVRRVMEYGLTESRVYLLICGGIMTVGVGLFLIKRFRSYLNLVIFIFIVLAAFAYIPVLSAAKLAVSSQTERVHDFATHLNLLDTKGHLILEERQQIDSSEVENYHQLYESLSYLEREAPAHLSALGLSESYDFLNIFSDQTKHYIEYGAWPAENHSDRFWIVEKRGGWKADFSGYNEVYSFESFGDPNVYSSYKNGVLTLSSGDSVLFSISGKDLMNQQLGLHGYSLEQMPDESVLRRITPDLLLIRTDLMLLKMDRITIDRKEKGLEVADIDVSLLLRSNNQ